MDDFVTYISKSVTFFFLYFSLLCFCLKFLKESLLASQFRGIKDPALKKRTGSGSKTLIRTDPEPWLQRNGIDMRTMPDMTPDRIPGQIVQIAAWAFYTSDYVYPGAYIIRWLLRNRCARNDFYFLRKNLLFNMRFQHVLRYHLINISTIFYTQRRSIITFEYGSMKKEGSSLQKTFFVSTTCS